MRLVFIQPIVKNPGNNFMPLGIGYLAAYLGKAGHQSKIIDLEVEKYEDQKLIEVMDGFRPDAVGLTATIASMNEARRLGRIFSGKYQWVLYGGPQPTLDPEYFLAADNNIVVRGEGEETLLELCQILSGSADLSAVKGIVYLKNGKVITNPPRDFIRDIDAIPFPSRELYHLDFYEMYLKDKKATNIITSRGCPFECVFCYNMGGRIYRFRSAGNVLEELEMLKERYGFGAFSIYDDNFTVNRQRLKDICQGMIERKMNMAWRCLSRVNTLDIESLLLMKKAGCFEIAFGVESGSQKSLDLMKKRIKVEDSKKIIELCRKAGIASKAYMMLGFPWETKEDIETTVSFLEEVVPDRVQLMCVTPMPNTDLWRMVTEKGYAIDNEVDYTRLKKAVYGTENFTKEELNKLAVSARRRWRAARRKYAFLRPFSFSARVYFDERLRKLTPRAVKRAVRILQRKKISNNNYDSH